ncbi:hypothetical protein S40293_08779 [Stachybotrys chartarum IBT 40293]|nr:hypothetical protein S40293_08779 [Stachybotrys chartarum IBT 40293]KFA79237.1 hypothetical protein S40288_02396 [Stachybotrys chartarum IBT 40288]
MAEKEQKVVAEKQPDHTEINDTTGKDFDILESDVQDTSIYSDEYFRKLLLKIDLWLLPLIWGCYETQQADKTSLGVQARLRHPQGHWPRGATVQLAQHSLLPGKCHMGKFLSTVMILWGIVVLCIAFAENSAYIMILPSFQGALKCTI